MRQRKELLIKYNLQWFAKDGPGGEKTEPATAKKLREAREDGKVAKSKELTAAFSLIVLFLVLKIFIGNVGTGFLEVFHYVFNMIPDFISINAKDLSTQAISSLFLVVIQKMLVLVAPFFIFGFAITLIISIVQVGWKISAKPMKPKFDKFNPVNGFKRIFSKDSLFELLKSILKIVLIAIITYTSIKDKAKDIFILYDIHLNQALAMCGDIILDTGLKISIVYLVIGIADWVFQKYRFNEDMKMTKQEVKDEYKNTEGDPQIKGKQRQRMREASARRMMQDVPKADVVITNPTHIAVAVKYDAEKQRAPVVLAKGEDHLAQRIREAAKEHNIQIVENKPLARMLYANVDIGSEIPPELYQAVAEILAMVYNNKH